MIKKRVIISVILTLLAVWGSHNYWLNVKPIDMSFKINGDNIQQVEARLYKYANENSEKFYSHRTDVNVKKHVKFSFKKPYSPKRLKLLISLNSLEGGGDLYELNLKHNKIKLNDFENFSAKGATLKVKDNKLYFSPTDKNVLISYNKKLKLNASTKFDFLVLLIIAIITYLFAYKITSYLADFKINKDKSRIDIIFLAIFFLILFIPMMRISNAKTSKSENRTLAVYKPLFKSKGRLNFNYGKDFDSWFSDRFNLREKIIFAQHQANYKVRSNFVEMNNKFIFKNNGYIINNYAKNFIPFTNEELERYSRNIYKFNKFCEDNNIKLYVVIPPSQLSYNQKYMLTYHNLHNEDRVIKFIDYAKKKYNLTNIIFPENELQKNENGELIYFKTDHHLTDYGSYILYKHLINTMKKDLPLLTITQQKDFKIYKRTLTRYEYHRNFNEGCEYINAKIKAPELLKTEYIYYDYKYPEKIKITGTKAHKTFINHDGHYKLLIMGDSYMENLLCFLNTSFYKIEKYRTNIDQLKNPKRKSEFEIKAYEKIIKDYKPDAIILIKHSGTLDAIKNMYPKENNN